MKEQSRKRELKKLYANAESCLKIQEDDIEQFKADIEAIELSFVEGGLPLNEFVESLCHDQDQIKRAVAYQQAICRALYLISKKIEEAEC
jgi:hypothetical protein